MKKNDWLTVISVVAVLAICAVMIGRPQLWQDPKSCMALCCFMFFYACVISIINFVGYRKVLANPDSEIEKVHTQGLSDVALLIIIGSILAIGVILWYCYQYGLTVENVNMALMWLEVLELPILVVILLVCCKVHGFRGKLHTILEENLNLVITKSYWGFWNLTVAVTLVVNVNSLLMAFTEEYLGIALVADIIFVVLLAFVTVWLREIISNELYRVEEGEQQHLCLDMLKVCGEVTGVMFLLIPFIAAACIGFNSNLFSSTGNSKEAVRVVFASIAAFQDIVLACLVGNFVRMLKTHLKLQAEESSVVENESKESQGKVKES